jgi:UDP-GlcNAc3NAcA epimerase
MQMKKIVTIVGARPQFIKLAPLAPLLDREFEHTIIHTGQHYDKNMSAIFFEEMNIREPDIQLTINGSTHAQQTGCMLMDLEKEFIARSPDMAIVFGDTNSTLAAALAGAKLNIPICHIEAGLRSFDQNMPEEINRVAVDTISAILSCPTQTAVLNLKREGIAQNVMFHGDIMLDAQLHFLNMIDSTKEQHLLETYKVSKENYAVCTLHRPSNTDHQNMLSNIIETMGQLEETIIFPMHPRTKKQIKHYDIKLPQNVIETDPLGYLDMLTIIKQSKYVLTDSGGLQKDAFFLEKPCITLRDTTEWVETLPHNCNQLVLEAPNSFDASKLMNAVDVSRTASFESQPFGDGRTCQAILRDIQQYFEAISQ